MSHNETRSRFTLALRQLDTLPSMPEIAYRLLALPLDTEAGEARLLSLIEQDPQLSARIIGLANSPAMGIAQRTHSIQDAAFRLGLQRLKAVAIGMATLAHLAGRPASRNFDPHDLWSHSITVAIVMSQLAQSMPKQTRPDENQVFLSGLLHDIGFMALHHLDPAASNELHHQVRLQPKRPISEIELALLGTTHGHLGALLLRHWHLPDELIAVAEQHHSPLPGASHAASLLPRMADIAERLLQDFGVAEHCPAEITADEWRELGIAPAHCEKLVAIVNEVAAQVILLPETGRPQSAQQTPTRHDIRPAASTARYSGSAPPDKGLLSWARRIWR